MSRQRDWQKKQIAKGNCRDCGKPRVVEGVERGTETRCRRCADEWNRYQREGKKST